MTTATIDPAMAKIRAIWAKKQADGMTLTALGLAMGYEPETARQAATQFLRGNDPRMSSVRRFASAVGLSMATLTRD